MLIGSAIVPRYSPTYPPLHRIEGTAVPELARLPVVSWIATLDAKARVYQFLFRSRRWWLPLRLVGWGYAYFIVGFVALVCLLLTMAFILTLAGGY
jgi:hypothetical protein